MLPGSLAAAKHSFCLFPSCPARDELPVCRQNAGMETRAHELAIRRTGGKLAGTRREGRRRGAAGGRQANLHEASRAARSSCAPFFSPARPPPPPSRDLARWPGRGARLRLARPPARLLIKLIRAASAEPAKLSGEGGRTRPAAVKPNESELTFRLAGPRAQARAPFPLNAAGGGGGGALRRARAQLRRSRPQLPRRRLEASPAGPVKLTC